MNTDKAFIRFAYDYEAQDIAQIYTSAWKTAYRGLISDEYLDGLSSSRWLSHIEKNLDEGYPITLVLENNALLAGTSSLGEARDSDLDDSYGEIWSVYLLPEYWSLGLGHRLLEFGLNELVIMGYTNASIWVLPENKRAVKSYEKAGFVFDGVTKEIDIGGSLVTDARMTKKL